MTLEELLEAYESKVKFNAFDLSTDLSQLEESEKNRFETQSELLAMSFSDDTGKEHWGTYYGPLTSWVNKKTGEELFSPDKSSITEEDIEYWARRANATSSPILKMRYTGLVWDFGKSISGREPDYKTIKLANIEACIDIIKQDLADHPISGLVYIKHAIEKAISLKNKELATNAMEAMIKYTRKYSTDETPGIWGKSFNMLISHLDYFQRYEKDVLNENIQRFERLEKKCDETYNKTDNYAHLLKDQCELLCEYYSRKNNKEMISQYIYRTLAKAQLFFKLRGSLWSQGMLQLFQSLFRKYNLNKEAAKLYIGIQELGSGVMSEMKSNYYTIPYNQKDLDKYFDYLMQGSTEEILKKYILRYIPIVDKEKELQKQEAKQAPLMDMVRTVAYDWAGMPINNINSEKQKLSYGMFRRLLFNTIFMQIHIQRMRDKEIYTYDNIMSLIKQISFINKEQLPILEQGVKAYFNDDNIYSCHLLTTQFESSIRTLAALTGHEVLRANKNASEGNEYISLEGLLVSIEQDDNNLIDVFTYYKTLFTDKYGWNIRNLICHGALAASSFNSVMADRIMHAIMTLSLIKLEKQ